MTSTSVLTHTHFLQRDKLYDHEKPYSLRFTAPPGLARANIKLDKRDIIVNDIRPKKKSLSLESNGCFIWDFDTGLSYDDFDDKTKVKDVYLAEVAEGLRKKLGAEKVQIFEHTLRKRHAEFPISTGEPYAFNQPTSIAHVDTTIPWCHAMARQLNPRDESVTDCRIQCVNIWKPLRGPVQDWPLALCDPNSVRSDYDLEPCDLVYPDYVVENRQVYHSDNLQWFYISEQRENEAWVFMQTDTGRSDWTVAHTAFPLPNAPKNAAPRESIEVRALVYYEQ
ncbi:hypothetical protein LTS14_007761 [Recurvomyces mirabilis]|uniref:uncharacterized protein n=1 Tax=Recurvomyces mirabilis TaxID=574656 RepID=UPI002DDF435B|nr:hypothetical protein LTS14_007761 [Recurvomyces mirabilis]